MRFRLTFLLAALIALAPSVHAQRTSGGGRGGSSSAPSALSYGLLAWFPMNENTGSAFVDNTGYANNATFSNGPTYAAVNSSGPCSSNYAGHFVAASLQFAQAPANAAYAFTYLTVSGCISTSTTTGNQEVAGMDTGSGNRVFQFRTNNTTMQLLIWLGGTVQTINGAINVANGSTHEVVATYNGAKACIYVDGNQDTCSSVSGAMTVTTGTPITIASASAAAYFNGNLWNVRLYNVPMSARDIKAMYTSGN